MSSCLVACLCLPGDFGGEEPLAHLPRDVPIPSDPFADPQPLDLRKTVTTWGPLYLSYQILSIRGEVPTALEHTLRRLVDRAENEFGLVFPRRQLDLWERLTPSERRTRWIEARRVQLAYEERIHLGDRAAAVIERYLAFCRAIGDRAGVGRMLRYLGDLKEQEGDGSRALDFWEEAFLEIKKTGWPPNIVDYEGKLAVGYSRRGLHDQARRLLEDSYRVAESYGSLLNKARILGRLGTIDFREGELDAARERFEGALEHAIEAGSPVLMHSQLNNLGALETRLGDYEKAYEIYARALREGLPAPALTEATRANTSNFYYRGQTLAGLGKMYLLAGRPRRSYLHLAQSLAQFRAIGEIYEESQVLDTLADLDIGSGKLAEALRFTERSLEIKRGMRDDVGVARSFVRLGRIALARDRPQEARGHLEEAHHRALRFHDPFVFITSTLYMGETYRAEERWTEAKKSLREGANLAWENGLPVQEAMAKLLLARIYRQEGKEPLAESTLREAIEGIERFRGGYPMDSFHASIFGELGSAYEEMIALLVDGGAEPESSLEFAEMSRARTLLDILSGREFPLRELPSEEEIEAVLEDPAGESSRIEGTVEVAALLPFPEDALPPMRGPTLVPDAWDYMFEGPPIEDEITGPDLPPEDLKALSARGTVLVEYACLEDRLVAWIIRDGEVESLVLPVTRAEIAGLVHEALPALTLSGEFQQLNPSWPGRAEATRVALVELADKILHPLLPYLEGAVEIVFLPDGPLYLVPFAALPTRTDGEEPLVSRSAVRLAPSLTTLQKLGEKETGRALLSRVLAVGFGGPFPRTGSSSMPPDSLPRALEEARMVGRLAENGTVLLGKEATESNVRDRLPTATLVHLASHAVADRDQPLISYVSMARGPGDDGLFTMQEVLESRLEGQPLVVLSACETALGRFLPGEGILGLTQSFLAAGASSVVSTLWAVTDQAAFDFMTEFYQSLPPEGTSPSRALQLAQLRHLAKHRRPDDPLAHPYYWAPFTVTGE